MIKNYYIYYAITCGLIQLYINVLKVVTDLCFLVL